MEGQAWREDMVGSNLALVELSLLLCLDLFRFG